MEFTLARFVSTTSLIPCKGSALLETALSSASSNSVSSANGQPPLADTSDRMVLGVGWGVSWCFPLCCVLPCEMLCGQ
eukprot:4913556-Amphidinium_carterae.1